MDPYNPLVSRRRVLPFMLSAASLLFCLTASAADSASPKHTFNVPAGPAEISLKLFSEQSGRGVIFSTDSLKDVRTQGVQGDFTAREALDRMTQGTALVVTHDSRSGAFAVRLPAKGESKNG